MNASAPHLGEPCVHGTTMHGFRAAAVALWGDEGLRDIARRISPEANRVLVDAIVTPLSWIPERLHVEWVHAVWEGPAGRDKTRFFAYCNRTIDEGWGRVRRALVAVATPAMLARRAGELWRREHTHGILTATLDERPGHDAAATGVSDSTGLRRRPDRGEVRGSALIQLRDHGFVAVPLMRDVISEAFRYILSLSRVGTVRGSHGLDASGALVVRLTWA